MALTQLLLLELLLLQLLLTQLPLYSSPHTCCGCNSSLINPTPSYQAIKDSFLAPSCHNMPGVEVVKYQAVTMLAHLAFLCSAV